MRQRALSGFDDLAALAGLAPGASQVAAVPSQDAPPAIAALASPAVNELLELIQLDMALPPLRQDPVAEQPAARLALGPGTVELQPSPDPSYDILPLDGQNAIPLALDDQDLFGAGAIAAPVIAPPDGVPDLFRGFQLDLFGDEAVKLPSLEVGIDVLPDPKAPPTFDTGTVTMFDGHSQLDLSTELAAALVDENGRLVIDGDGDDTVLLSQDWKLVSQGETPANYSYYVDSDSGMTVGIRGADVIYV